MTSDNIRVRIRTITSIVLVPSFIWLVWCFYKVQIIKHEYYLKEARSRYTTTRITTGKRGEIYDNTGNLLVSNLPCVNITCDPYNLTGDSQRRKLAYILAKHLDDTYESFYKKLSPIRPKYNSDGKPLLNPDGSPVVLPRRYVMLKRGASLDETAQIREQTRINKIRVLNYTDSYMRIYPKGAMLSNVLGYTNVVDDTDVAQGGLEKELNSEMNPERGHERYERTRDGMPLSYGLQDFESSRDGKNIYLTVNEPIQAILEDELDATFEKWKPATLYAAIVDPKTGNILAIAQRPTFNPNIRSTFTPEAARTRIAEDSMEPGSIVKPFTIGKAIDWDVITPSTEVDCNKGLWVYLNKPMRDSHPSEVITVEEVIQKSSNIGTAKIALMLGEQRVHQALKTFKLGEKTGLPFPIEAEGLVPPLTKWDKLSVTRFPIGYGIRVTPLQMIRAYCALANDGWMPQLRLIDRVEDPLTGEEIRIQSDPPVQVFEKLDTCATLVNMMIKVTQPGGTAVNAAIPGYEIAGKTGTSRKYIPTKHDKNGKVIERGHYADGKYFSSFVGFVPARNPALLMLITLDEPKGSYYAATVAAPTFKTTMTRVLRHLNIQPDPALLKKK